MVVVFAVCFYFVHWFGWFWMGNCGFGAFELFCNFVSVSVVYCWFGFVLNSYYPFMCLC